MNVKLSKLSYKLLLSIKQLYTITDQQIDEDPYIHLALNLDIAEMVPLKPFQQSLYNQIISHRIFIPGDIRQPSLYSVPDDIAQYPIPHPKYT